MRNKYKYIFHLNEINIGVKIDHWIPVMTGQQICGKRKMKLFMVKIFMCFIINIFIYYILKFLLNIYTYEKIYIQLFYQTLSFSCLLCIHFLETHPHKLIQELEIRMGKKEWREKNQSKKNDKRKRSKKKNKLHALCTT